ncbi:MAG TPA: FAD:protein FMN transferase [Sporichthyaceae bacterium]|jgi:thiamine biosynthesis lipoprotein
MNSSADWTLWSTTARVVVTDPAVLPAALHLIRAELALVEAACNRFSPDSELSLVCAQAVDRPLTTTVSPMLSALLRMALEAAERTDGDLDPTLGAALIGLGYDRDYLLIGPDDRPPVRPRRVDWRAVRLTGDRLSVPAGTVLDLGATAKAAAADHCAQLTYRQFNVGVLIELGGDLATAGPAPHGGWRIDVQDRDEDPADAVTLPAGAALATSSTQRRVWRRGGTRMHHVLDPRTALPVAPVWRSASVVAGNCVAANTLSTAALIRGQQAPGWLRRIGAPAWLVDAAGSTHAINGWPA